MGPYDWRSAARRIDALAVGDSAEELVRVVADLYGAGLERILEVLHEQGALTDEVAAALAGDDLVTGLLLVHGLHPYDAKTRITAALEGTGVEVVEVTADGVCRLRLPAGHPPHGLQQTVEAVAPEVTRIETEQPPPVIPVSSLFSRVGGSS
ncbi:hypothetical protein JIG36_00115 [Actinoplanes sp. LDG1-06]|uniref:Uncharacterized protein n=1 Tax=Paractinoplanes ovalisporus TaxID=2810368 RepID=A0ABS2A3V2_9ACTN|nr:hypothetical protein [Actinoplanes ovalisporus]MBM2613958.1 hypothetical protein [Actinoplanes ovalisporus]